MIGSIAAADGAPCPTLVLDRRELPRDPHALQTALAAVRAQLVARGFPEVLKIALIRPAEHPMFDLSYRFVQVLPGPDGDRFDLLGSCGHSIVAATLVANQLGWIPRLAPGHRVRVSVENNGDVVVCEVDELDRRGGNVTVHFLQEPATHVTEFLVTGAPVDTLAVGDAVRRVSLVSMGNPYVFVRAGDLGVTTREQLFADDAALFARLGAIRAAAAARWGWPATSAFPKIAVLDAFSPGRLTVRAISVPKWHPTLALTGATCLAVASVIPGTIPHDVAREAGCEPERVVLETPNATVTAFPAVTGPADAPRLAWVSVAGKRARYLDRVALDLPHVPTHIPTDPQRELVA